MSHPLHLYHTELERIIHYGGTKKETAIRTAFFNLLNDYAKQRNLILVAELSIKTSSGKIVTPDGTLKDSLRQDWGYWESKDEADNLDDEIEKKFAKGYPKDNILFEDSRMAVLIQNGEQVMRCTIDDDNAMHRLLTEFVTFERPEVQNFRKAIELFKQDIPKVTGRLYEIITDVEDSRLFPLFDERFNSFLQLCRESINPGISNEDVREMMIQHILTEDIFNTIFDETQFHRENNIARELEAVIATFFTGNLRRETLRGVKHYYDAISAAAACIADHHEKQRFLKVVYETFYKSYNPKAADRLGVVYTPNEIVRFMIESTDYLLQKHFNKYLEDRNVEILDPATGTGTFICDIINYIRKEKLEHKYRNEIHANEVAILPYYISNLNIEFTYAQKMGRYVEFENLCFVDTLDNIGGLRAIMERLDRYSIAHGELFAISQKNSLRIKEQNRKKISIIIGNPPYNANQANENDNNKNREYTQIDMRIKDTFIKYSTAQKTKVYDMYSRFYRWAFDRLDDNGIVAFVTNRSFIDSRTFDGFRKTIQNEFEEVYIIDTLSDVRANPKIAGTTHNVFGIQTGVAIMFLIKKQNREKQTCRIHYVALNDFWRKEQKLQWLSDNPLRKISFDIIRPDKNNNWIHLADNDFDELLPLVGTPQSLFGFSSLGVSTNRDEWVFDIAKENLMAKIKYFVENYTQQLVSGIVENEFLDYSIKWSDSLKNILRRKDSLFFHKENLIYYLYRPFYKIFFYSEKKLSDRLTSNHIAIFDENLSSKNIVISFSGVGSSKSFSTLVTNILFSMDLLEKTQCLPLYRYDKSGVLIDNITNWGFQQFVEHYHDDAITKFNIFNYIYAVLHNPSYRQKYELNLKREFPRIPFYDNFHQWAHWGERLMNLHIHYENAEPYPLRLIQTNVRANLLVCPKPKLKAIKTKGVIILDEQTELHDIPQEAWNYQLGNRSALEWIIDQYQEKRPKDPTIAKLFNTYRFADYKEQVIELLKRVCTVSIETMRIIKEMENNHNK